MNLLCRNVARTAGWYAAVVIFLCSLLFSRSLAAQWNLLPEDCKVASPDGHFVARLTEDFYPTLYDRHPASKTSCLSIEDRLNNTAALAGVLSPVFLIAWTRDSQSIVVVGHIAGGSYAEVLHYHEGQWQRHEVDPLSQEQIGHYAVVRLKMGLDRFRVTFKVADSSAGQTEVEFYLCTLEVDAATGMVLHAGPRRAISYDVYGQMFLCGGAGSRNSR